MISADSRGRRISVTFVRVAGVIALVALCAAALGGLLQALLYLALDNFP